ncbi:MAG: hypothetical protein KF760_17050 [Candidatus Eremiobacteraeota bacterium]|nr:hypothetical protein [Candidatus Eremiobacteraeota bacterium]MCW5870147.1 hypothetical protein [Candidatus Eremiobacteraeota bacterium]
MSLTLEELSRRLLVPLRGDPQARVDSACPLESPRPNAICFCEKANQVKFGPSDVGILIAPGPPEGDWNVLLSTNPRVTFAQALRLLYPEPALEPGVHETAWVEPSAQVHPRARVGPLCLVEAGAVVEEGAELVAQVTLGAGCRVGEGSKLWPGSSLAAGCAIGKHCVLEPGARVLAGSSLGDAVWLGSRAVVDGAALATGIKADNQIYVGPGSQIGPHALLISQSCLGPNTRMGAYSLVAAQGAVLGEVEIGPQVQIAGRCVIAESVPEKGSAWAGDPAVPYSLEMRNRALRLKALPVYLQRTRRS